MAIILPANTLSTGGYEVANSCRFNPPDAPYFAKNPTGDGNQRTFTISVWLKMDIHASGATHKVFETGTSTNYFTIYFTTEPYLYVKGRVSSSTVLELVPSRSFRDPTAWFHLYVAVDTTQGTASDRCKIYINGSQVTSFGTATYPSQNTDFENQDASEPFEIGVNHAHGSDEHFDGYMAEYMYVDGAVQAIGDFGEFDEDSPTIWKPKDISAIDVNPGAAQASNGNGFYLDFKDSSNLGNDVGVNAGTDFAENNIVAADQATDTPTNNFCTLNPLIRQIAEETGGLKEGNTEVLFSGASWGGVSSTMAPAAGKWYFEGKLIANGSNSIIGVVPANTQGKDNTGTWYIGQYSGEQAYQNNGAASNGGASFGNTYTDGDIIGVMLDCDNAKVYFSKNGSLENSGNPSSGSTGTGAMSLTAGEFYTPAVSGNGVTNWEMNFGNPPYANSSDAADGNGYGAFEYAPPSGYLAICTKNLGSDGG